MGRSLNHRTRIGRPLWPATQIAQIRTAGDNGVRSTLATHSGGSVSVLPDFPRNSV